MARDSQTKMTTTMTISYTHGKKFECSGATIVDGFPSVGLVSTIAANYIVDMLKLKLIASVTSPRLPQACIIRNGLPLPPVRVYANDKIVVFVSEFPPPQDMVLEMVDLILDFAKKSDCSMIISPEGIPKHSKGDDIQVYGVPSSEKGVKLLGKHEIKSLPNGIIAGVSGMLLCEASQRGADVVCILSEAHPSYPDARSAAEIVEIIDKMMPEISLDTTPLYVEAETIEKTIKGSLAKMEGFKKTRDEKNSGGANVGYW